MADDRSGFLVYTLEELRAHLREEIRKNPFIDVPQIDTGTLDDDEPPPAPDGSAKNPSH